MLSALLLAVPAGAFGQTGLRTSAPPVPGVAVPALPSIGVPALRPLETFSAEIDLRDLHLQDGQTALFAGQNEIPDRTGKVVTVDGRRMVRRDSDGALLPMSTVKNMDGFPVIKETGADGREYAVLYRAVGLNQLQPDQQKALVARILDTGLESAGRSVFGEDLAAWRRTLLDLNAGDIADRAQALEAAWDAGIWDNARARSVTYFMPFTSDPQFAQWWAGERKVIVKARVPYEAVSEMETEAQTLEAMRTGRLEGKKAILAPEERYESEYTWTDTVMPVEYITDVFLPEDLLPGTP